MKAEKVILSFVAIIVGLAAAGAAFYFYQMSKTLPTQQTKPVTLTSKVTPSPTPDANNIFTIENPKDEQVFDKKVIDINGKTAKGATVVVSTEDSDQVVKPASNGDFSLTATIPDGTTFIRFTAIFPNGEEKAETRTVTYSTENF